MTLFIHTSPTAAGLKMENDATVGKASGSDDEMNEGSDGEWDNVASGSENYGGDENENADGDQQEADADDDDDGGDEDDDEERDLIILCSRSLGRCGGSTVVLRRPLLPQLVAAYVSHARPWAGRTKFAFAQTFFLAHAAEVL